jgi:hypothetical protein
MPTEKVHSNTLENLRVKGSDRIQVNNILCAVSIGALTVILSLGGSGQNLWLVGQLALPIPLLVTSSLAYAKLSYRGQDEFFLWDNLGWVTHSLGYIMILNAMALLLYRNGYVGVVWIFVAVNVALFLTYSIIDITAKKSRKKEKLIKLGFYLLCLFFGTLLPVLSGWI